LKYTIDVTGILTTTHRLKKDDTFKKFFGEHDKEIMDDDLTFDNYYEAKRWKQNHKFIEVEEKRIEVSPTMYGLTDPAVEIRPHRTGKPKKPYITMDDLKQVLLKGDDQFNNSLIIDFDGYLHLLPFDQAKNSAYAVRFETFVAGNGYVGSEKSIEDIEDIEDTYLSLLEGWVSHLVGHDTVYRDYPSSSTLDELLVEIEEAINEL
jgi:hypothetical protein